MKLCPLNGESHQFIECFVSNGHTFSPAASGCAFGLAMSTCDFGMAVSGRVTRVTTAAFDVSAARNSRAENQ